MQDLATVGVYDGDMLMPQQEFEFPEYIWPDDDTPLEDRVTYTQGYKLTPEEPCERSLHNYMSLGVKIAGSYFKLPTRKCPTYRYTTVDAWRWWKEQLTLIDNEVLDAKRKEKT